MGNQTHQQGESDLMMGNWPLVVTFVCALLVLLTPPFLNAFFIGMGVAAFLTWLMEKRFG